MMIPKSVTSILAPNIRKEFLDITANRHHFIVDSSEIFLINDDSIEWWVDSISKYGYRNIYRYKTIYFSFTDIVNIFFKNFNNTNIPTDLYDCIANSSSTPVYIQKKLSEEQKEIILLAKLNSPLKY